jgi:dihydroorotate dehydrogenase (fumarate)
MDIAASTGIHSSESVIKQILAGATAVQVCSILYKKGIEQLPGMISGVEDWMDGNNYQSIDDFRGLLSYKNIPDPAIYERSQFMKYFSSYH